MDDGSVIHGHGEGSQDQNEDEHHHQFNQGETAKCGPKSGVRSPKSTTRSPSFYFRISRFGPLTSDFGPRTSDFVSTNPHTVSHLTPFLDSSNTRQKRYHHPSFWRRHHPASSANPNPRSPSWGLWESCEGTCTSPWQSL